MFVGLLFPCCELPRFVAPPREQRERGDSSSGLEHSGYEGESPNGSRTTKPKYSSISMTGCSPTSLTRVAVGYWRPGKNDPDAGITIVEEPP